MTPPSEPTRTSDVPTLVFEQFLKALEGAGVPPELSGRLRKTLLEDKSFTDRALKEAVLGQGAEP